MSSGIVKVKVEMFNKRTVTTAREERSEYRAQKRKKLEERVKKRVKPVKDCVKARYLQIKGKRKLTERNNVNFFHF